MNRRGFMQLIGGTVGGLLLEEAIPLGRVWSFPSKIVAAPLGTVLNIRMAPRYSTHSNHFLTADMITREALKILYDTVEFQKLGFANQFWTPEENLPRADWRISNPVILPLPGSD